jgi:Arc/MetJ-type ribon-helix-helix transcriptional regulator
MAKKIPIRISVRMSARLKKLIKKCVQNGLYPSVSEFTRDALREKLARDAPELYREDYLAMLQNEFCCRENP